MSRRTERIEQYDFDAEEKLIYGAGTRSLWGLRIVMAVVASFDWAYDFMFGKAWTGKEIAITAIGVLLLPYFFRAIAKRIMIVLTQNERLIRVEAKLDALMDHLQDKNADRDNEDEDCT